MNRKVIITQELIEHLESLYDTQVRRSDTDRDVWVKVGHREVLDKLKDMYNEDVPDVYF